MSLQSLLGLTVLNALLLVSGASVLWLLRGWTTWLEVARLAGVAYVFGVALVGSLWTLLLIAGVPFGLITVLGVPALVAALSALGSVGRGRTLPQLVVPRPGPGLYVAAVGIALTGVLLEALFRKARLAGLYAWDAWAFWVPKGKAIYLFGGLDEKLFADLPGPSYPPLVPVLDASAFHVMGSADVVTLHVQFWFLGVGFLWALAGVLAERVPAWILWPFVLLVLVAPRIGPRFIVTEADLLLNELFVLAALLVVLWMGDRADWRLAVATVLMSGMVLTKREGLLLAAVLVVAAGLASIRSWRSIWPKLALRAVVVGAVAIPWRLWYIAHGIEGEAPSGGVDPTENAGRLWPSVRLAWDVLFSSDYWSVIVPVAIGAIVVALLAREYVLASFVAAAVALVTLGGGWITWAIPELPITQELGGNPIVRYMGSAALLCVSASPLLIASAWAAVTRNGREAA